MKLTALLLLILGFTKNKSNARVPLTALKGV